MITAAGVGSGIDVESILSQLMELERQPINALNARKSRLDVELSAFGTVKSAIDTLAASVATLGDSTRFGPFVATSSDEEVVTTEATGGGAGEFHDIEVLSIAQNHRMSSRAYDSDADSVNSGSWSFSSGLNTFEVDISPGSNSLVDLKSEINNSADNTSIVASILKVDGGSRLVLTAKDSGTENVITFGNNSGTANFTTISDASDASIVVDGFDVTSSSNTIADVISGVTLTLRNEGQVKVETNRDMESLRTNLDELVTQYNQLRTTLGNLSQEDLQGDRMPRNLEFRVREVFNSPINLSNNESVLPQSLGFSFDRFGALSIDESRLNEALKSGPENFINAFAQNESGFAQKLDDVFQEYTRGGGIIDGRENGIDARKRSIDSQIDRMDYRLEKTEERYRRQFTVMDQLVSNLQSTGNLIVNRLSDS